MPACIFNFYLLSFSCAYQFKLNTNLSTTCHFSCIIHLHVLLPNANPIIITWLVLHLHLTSFKFMCQHALILALYFLLHLCVSTLSSSSKPQNQPSLVFHSLYHVSLAWLCLWLLLSCFFVQHFHCAPCVAPSLTHSVLLCIFSLWIITSRPLLSLPPSIALCSLLLQLWILYLSMCLAPQILCQRIIYLAAWHVPSLPKYHTSNAPSCYTLHLCGIQCHEFLPCKFVKSHVLHLWLAFVTNTLLNPMSSLVPLSCFCFALFVHRFLASLCLALLTLITCITSLASLCYSWIPLSCTLSFFVYHNLAPLNPLSITCRAPLSCIFGLLYLAQSYTIFSMVFLYFLLA